MNTFTIRIPDYPIMDNKKLYDFCLVNPEIKIERKANGELELMSPTGGKTGNRNFKISKYLGDYSEKIGSPSGIVFDSSTGFTLPDGSMKSPDSAWIKKERWENLTEDEKEMFPPICPDFIIELLSKTDKLELIQSKMLEWIQNGCQLGWLIDPFKEKVYIYRANGEMKILQSFQENLNGENILPGFELPLKELLI